MTRGGLNLGPGTLYGTIKRMIASKLIEETDERPDPKLDDEHRRYYKQTTFGRRVTAAEVRRVSDLLKAAQIKGLNPGSVRWSEIMCGAWTAQRLETLGLGSTAQRASRTHQLTEAQLIIAIMFSLALWQAFALIGISLSDKKSAHQTS
jgi:hypothetical protein